VTFFDKVFHPSLSAFRSGYGGQTALLQIIEDWKKALDENKFVAAILMDLSKAFDCLPHKLLINKLDAYGVSIAGFANFRSFAEMPSRPVAFFESSFSVSIPIGLWLQNSSSKNNRRLEKDPG
jgi:hypothetical protein